MAVRTFLAARFLLRGVPRLVRPPAGDDLSQLLPEPSVLYDEEYVFRGLGLDWSGPYDDAVMEVFVTCSCLEGESGRSPVGHFDAE